MTATVARWFPIDRGVIVTLPAIRYLTGGGSTTYPIRVAAAAIVAYETLRSLPGQPKTLVLVRDYPPRLEVAMTADELDDLLDGTNR